MTATLRRITELAASVVLLALLVVGAGASTVRIIPQPQELAWEQGKGFATNASTAIVISPTADSKDIFTANQLRRKIWDTTGRLPRVLKADAKAPTRNVIAIGEAGKNRVVAALLKSWPQAAGKKARSEGYMLGVRDGAAVVAGFDQRGTFYGCQTLIQLFEQQGKGRISSLFCYDYPDLAWRGTQVRVRAAFDVDFTNEVVSEIMARCKMNVIELHMSYGTLWPSHPELLYNRSEKIANPSTFPQVIRVADTCRRHFIEVIPSGISWSHSWEWQTCDGMNADLLEPGRKDGGNICPRNPKAQKLMRDLIQDQINAFHPKYLNIGWDEIDGIGTCPYCKGEKPAELFADYIKRDRDYLASKGITTLIWADMLRPDMNGKPPWNIAKAVSLIPKDVIVGDWWYTGHNEDYPSLRIWNDNGLKSLAVPYGVYPPGPENICSWCKAAKKHGILGVMAFNKYTCPSKSSALANPNALAELSCFPFIGEWGWTADKPGYDPLPWDRVALVKDLIAPDSPSGLSASPTKSGVLLSWTNPPEQKFKATWVCFRTDRYPNDPLDGKFVCDAAGSPNGAAAFTHKSAPRAGEVYYSAFSHDGVRRFSAAARVLVGR